MFGGITNVNLDERGRLALPVRFRDKDDDRVVVTVNPHPGEKCLFLYPRLYWDKLEEHMAKLNTQLLPVRAFQRLFVGYATDVDLDSNGRVLLPQALRDHAELRKRAVVVGQLTKIEIWDEALWSAAVAQPDGPVEGLVDIPL